MHFKVVTSTQTYFLKADAFSIRYPETSMVEFYNFGPDHKTRHTVSVINNVEAVLPNPMVPADPNPLLNPVSNDDLRRIVSNVGLKFAEDRPGDKDARRELKKAKFDELFGTPARAHVTPDLTDITYQVPSISEHFQEAQMPFTVHPRMTRSSNPSARFEFEFDLGLDGQLDEATVLNNIASLFVRVMHMSIYSQRMIDARVFKVNNESRTDD